MLHAIKKALTKTTWVVAVVTLISKITGYFTAVVIGAKFGISRTTDAYLISLVIPDFLILLFAFPLGLGLTTLLTKDIAKGNEKRGWEFVSIIATLLLVIFLFASLSVFFLSPLISTFLTPGFTNESRAIVNKLNRISLGYMFFSGLTYIPRSILHSYRRFIIPAITPGLLQLGVIIFIVMYSKKLDIASANMGLFFGALFCFALQILSLRNKMREFNFRLRWGLYHPELKTMLNLVCALLLYSVVFQVNTGVDRIVASTLQAGSIAALDFAYRVNWMFLPVFAGALFIVILPIFSEQAAAKNWDNFKEIFYSGITLLNFLIIPISIFIMFMATPLIRVLFERGVFNASATRLTSGALVMYSVGAVPFLMLHISSCALIALGDGRSIARISFTLILLNAIFDLILSRYLGHRGIALGTSLVSISGFWLYSKALRVKIGAISTRDMLGSFTKIIFISLITAVASVLAHNFLGTLMPTGVFTGQVIKMGAVIFFAVVLYLGLSYALGIPEMKELYLLLKTK